MGEQLDRSSARAVLDTTAVIDHFKTPARKRRIADELSRYGLKFSTSIGVLEFKATLLQQMMTIHGEFVKFKRFTSVRDDLIESRHPQAKLRAHIFNNILQVFPTGPVDELTIVADRRLAEKASLKLEIDIPELFREFRDEFVDAVLHDTVACDRAREAPNKSPSRKGFDVNIPTCHRGINKSCRVERVLVEKVLPVLEKIIPLEVRQSTDDQIPVEFAQLVTALRLAQEVAANPNADLNANQCRKCGDALITLEAAGRATHGVSTNRREWEPLCEANGLLFHHLQYPNEAAG